MGDKLQDFSEQWALLIANLDGKDDEIAYVKVNQELLAEMTKVAIPESNQYNFNLGYVAPFMGIKVMLDENVDGFEFVLKKDLTDEEGAEEYDK